MWMLHGTIVLSARRTVLNRKEIDSFSFRFWSSIKRVILNQSRSGDSNNFVYSDYPSKHGYQYVYSSICDHLIIHRIVSCLKSELVVMNFIPNWTLFSFKIEKYRVFGKNLTITSKAKFVREALTELSSKFLIPEFIYMKIVIKITSRCENKDECFEVVQFIRMNDANWNNRFYISDHSFFEKYFINSENLGEKFLRNQKKNQTSVQFIVIKWGNKISWSSAICNSIFRYWSFTNQEKFPLFANTSLFRGSTYAKFHCTYSQKNSFYFRWTNEFSENIVS